MILREITAASYSKKIKIRILTWNFVDVKGLVRIACGKEFRSFTCTLTEIPMFERLNALPKS